MRRTSFAALAAALACGVATAPAAADHSWNGYHWARTSNPFTVKLGDGVTSAWDGHLSTAASDWSATTAGNPLRTTVVAGSTTGKKCQPTLGRVEVCSAEYGRRRWLGVATIWVSSGGHIAQGTAKMNDTYFNTAFYNTRYWRGAVMCQEVGHTFGLDHQDESGADLGTCMDYAENPDEDNTHPNRHDYEELALIYSHLDSTTTVGPSAATRGARPYKVDRHDGRRTSTIVERFADGSKRVTFITWATRS